MATIAIAATACAVKCIVTPIVTSVVDAARTALLDITKNHITSKFIRNMLRRILTDVNKTRISSLMYVDFSQAMNNLSNANALLFPESSEVDQKAEIELLGLPDSRWKMLSHYLGLAEQAATRAYHFSRTCDIDFQFICAKLLVECSCLYAIQENLPSQEILRRLNQYKEMANDIMQKEYGEKLLDKANSWFEDVNENKNQTEASESKMNEILHEKSLVLNRMKELEEKFSKWSIIWKACAGYPDDFGKFEKRGLHGLSLFIACGVSDELEKVTNEWAKL